MTAGGVSRDQERWLLIDSWRGVAAMLVALFHLYNVVSPPEAPLALAPIDWFLRNGDSGVEIFFVLSGIVVTHNILASDPRTLGFLPRFGLRRSIRLDPPYWTLIALNLVAAAAVHSTAYDGVGPVTVLTNMLYLDNLLGARSIIPVGWTLCLELQFYLLIAVLLVLLRRFSQSALMAFLAFVPLWGWSVSIALGIVALPLPGLFLGHWYLFLMGAAIAMFIRHRSLRASLCVGAGLVALVAVAVVTSDASNLFAVGASITILVAAGAGRLAWPMGGAIVQYLGKISYSLYLVHTLVGSRVLRLLLRNHPVEELGAATRWALMAAGVAASVAFAHALWRFVERPAQRVSRRVSLAVEPSAPAPVQAATTDA
jgi:peptidoglycan/LPS O-acetylase OafA/YrhL